MAGTTRAGGKLTPVMQQYLDIKRGHEDAILFFRMGDFYEMFFEDAEKAARLLDITLTSRNRSDPNPIPMCGVPFHALRPYVARLMEAGQRVAICEQVELPGKGEKIARREVTRVVSPGTTLDEESLAPERSNYLAALVRDEDRWGLAVTDFSTGELRATLVTSEEAASDELLALAPAEIVCEAGDADGLRERLAAVLPRALVAVAEPRSLEDASPGFDALPEAARVACLLLYGYIDRTQGGATSHLRAPEYYDASGFVTLDEATRRNLELLQSYGGGTRGSLVSVLDRASTPMGKRLLRRWIVQPLADLGAIGERLDAVELFFEDYELRVAVRRQLEAIGDLERLAGRLGARSAGPRDVRRLAESLEAVAALRGLLHSLDSGGRPLGAVATLADAIDPCPEAAARIRRTLSEEPPQALGKGGVIRDGFDAEVDRLRSISRDGKGWIAAFEAEERRRTGVASLKVGFNKVFGYFIEITRANQHLVPEDYVRKQTLAGAERYITDALKAREGEVLGAEERLVALEGRLFGELLADLEEAQAALGCTAAALAALDVLAGLAEQAHRAGYVRPEFHGGDDLDIRAGRHPVVEAAAGARFVANDCALGSSTRQVLVITGPNMAGKSTYLRQTALIVLLAHCGSFVPADAARVPLVDRVFTRIGASDNLAAGQSTFMVEMSETAAILRGMTTRSLVVLDEIGRGTSTFDGISIAWAVAEAMVAARVKTLFATHYHELAGLALEHGAVENASVAVRRYKGEILFLYRIVPGPASGSYGIEVARLAGVPQVVIEKARTMLARFESGEGLPGMEAGSQLALFAPRGEAAPDPVLEALRGDLAALRPEGLTPLESLNILTELVERARKAQ